MYKVYNMALLSSLSFCSVWMGTQGFLYKARCNMYISIAGRGDERGGACGMALLSFDLGLIASTKEIEFPLYMSDNCSESPSKMTYYRLLQTLSASLIRKPVIRRAC